MTRIDWGAVAGLAASASAVFAGIQIRESRRSGLRQTSLGFLREIDERLAPIAAVKTEPLRAEIIAYRREPGETLSVDAQQYSAFLNALDRLSLAMAEGALDPTIVRPWLRGVLEPKDVWIKFIEQLQDAIHDRSVLEYLQRYLLQK